MCIFVLVSTYIESYSRIVFSDFNPNHNALARFQLGLLSISDGDGDGEGMEMHKNGNRKLHLQSLSING